MTAVFFGMGCILLGILEALSRFGTVVDCVNGCDAHVIDLSGAAVLILIGLVLIGLGKLIRRLQKQIEQMQATVDSLDEIIQIHMQ